MIVLAPAPGIRVPRSEAIVRDGDRALIVCSDSFRLPTARSAVNMDLVLSFALPDRTLVTLDAFVLPVSYWDARRLEVPPSVDVALWAPEEVFDENGIGSGYRAPLAYAYDMDRFTVLVRVGDQSAHAWFRCMSTVVCGLDERSQLAGIWLEGVRFE